MINLIAFETEKELRDLTGLTQRELIDNDWNIDDWDIGFQSDKKISERNLYWLWNCMSGYCVGYSEVKYKGKYYYLVHHS